MSNSNSAVAVVVLVGLWLVRHLGWLLLVPVGLYLVWEYGVRGLAVAYGAWFVVQVYRHARWLVSE